MKKKCVNSVKPSFADAQHLCPGCRAHQSQSTPTSTSDEQIPELVANKPVQQLHIPVQTPSNEEADREVAAICRPSEYYRVRSHLRRRHHYFMYNTLDDIGEINSIQEMT